MASMGDSDEFTAEQKRLILLHVRSTAQAKLDHRPLPNRDEEARAQGLFRKCGGVFVTYKNSGDLRGCIGIFVPEDPLWRCIESRALASLEDSRFAHNPITAAEFRDNIDICVSVLSTPVAVVGDPLKAVVVGKHGVICSKGYRRGTYLPQVATEQGWDTRTFLTHLAQHKAGIDSRNPLTDPAIHWETYTASLVYEREPQM